MVKTAPNFGCIYLPPRRGGAKTRHYISHGEVASNKCPNHQQDQDHVGNLLQGCHTFPTYFYAIYLDNP